MFTPRSNLEFRLEACFTLNNLNSLAKPIEPNYFRFSTMKLPLFTKKQMAQRSQTFAQGTKKSDRTKGLNCAMWYSDHY